MKLTTEGRQEIVSLIESKWIQSARKSMKKRGTTGKLGRIAAQHGMSTCAYARKLGHGNKMANFALNTGCRRKG